MKTALLDLIRSTGRTSWAQIHKAFPMITATTLRAAVDQLLLEQAIEYTDGVLRVTEAHRHPHTAILSRDVDRVSVLLMALALGHTPIFTADDNEMLTRLQIARARP